MPPQKIKVLLKDNCGFSFICERGEIPNFDEFRDKIEDEIEKRFSSVEKPFKDSYIFYRGETIQSAL